MTNAELSVIGSMLIDDNCISDVIEKLKASDFSSDIGKSIFSAISDAWLSGTAIDPVIVSQKCGDAETASKVMLSAMDVTPTTANTMEYANIVKRESLKRRASEIAGNIAFGDDVVECVSQLNELVSQSEEKELTSGDEWKERFSSVLERNMNDPDSAFCKTGYQDFDDMLGAGFVRGGVYILGARPGMGKTTFAINIAEKIAKRGQKVLFISLEMSPHQIMCKRVSLDTDIQYKRILYGKINGYEKEKIDKSVAELVQRPFFTNTGFSLTVSDIGSLAKRCKGCDCLVIDYFGLITATNETMNRYEAYSVISRQLKQLAGLLNLPILCLAQLNRELAKGRKDKKPQLSDLRDTGSLEQDADSVIFLHRDGYYDQAKKDECEIDVIVRKNRHGDCGEIKMQWYGQTGQICSFDAVHEDVKDGELEF